jgi:CsoR family transcriptional regulator, copper-sensing transcriptional repressor
MVHGHIKTPYKKRLIHRLRILQGQIRGLERAVDKEDYCISVLHQSSAVQESLKSFDMLMLENHLRTHVVHQFKGKGVDLAVKELLRIYKLNRR